MSRVDARGRERERRRATDLFPWIELRAKLVILTTECVWTAPLSTWKLTWRRRGGREKEGRKSEGGRDEVSFRVEEGSEVGKEGRNLGSEHPRDVVVSIRENESEEKRLPEEGQNERGKWRARRERKSELELTCIDPSPSVLHQSPVLQGPACTR